MRVQFNQREVWQISHYRN